MTSAGPEPLLHFAVKSGCSLAVLYALLERGAPICSQGSEAASILEALVTYGKQEWPRPRPIGPPSLFGPDPVLPMFPLPAPNLVMEAHNPTTPSRISELEDELILKARCLLRFGADPQTIEVQKSGTMTVADRADMIKRPRLARLLRHYSGWQQLCAVKRHRLLRGLAEEMQRNVLGFLVPETWIEAGEPEPVVARHDWRRPLSGRKYATEHNQFESNTFQIISSPGGHPHALRGS